MVLAPGCFITCMLMARSILPPVYIQAAFMSFSTLSTTLATSFSRTGVPLRQATTTCENPAASVNSPLVFSVKACRVPCSVPVGEFGFQFAMAWLTSLMPIFLLTSLSGSSCTRTAYLVAPDTCTCDTPLTIEMRGAMMVSA